MACDMTALSPSSTVSYISWMRSTTPAPASLPSYHRQVVPVPQLHSASQRSVVQYRAGKVVSMAWLGLSSPFPVLRFDSLLLPRHWRARISILEFVIAVLPCRRTAVPLAFPSSPFLLWSPLINSFPEFEDSNLASLRHPLVIFAIDCSSRWMDSSLVLDEANSFLYLRAMAYFIAN